MSQQHCPFFEREPRKFVNNVRATKSVPRCFLTTNALMFHMGMGDAGSLNPTHLLLRIVPAMRMIDEYFGKDANVTVIIVIHEVVRIVGRISADAAALSISRFFQLFCRRCSWAAVLFIFLCTHKAAFVFLTPKYTQVFGSERLNKEVVKGLPASAWRLDQRTASLCFKRIIVSSNCYKICGATPTWVPPCSPELSRIHPSDPVAPPGSFEHQAERFRLLLNGFRHNLTRERMAAAALRQRFTDCYGGVADRVVNATNPRMTIAWRTMTRSQPRWDKIGEPLAEYSRQRGARSFDIIEHAHITPAAVARHHMDTDVLIGGWGAGLMWELLMPAGSVVVALVGSAPYLAHTCWNCVVCVMIRILL